MVAGVVEAAGNAVLGMAVASPGDAALRVDRAAHICVVEIERVLKESCVVVAAAGSVSCYRGDSCRESTENGGHSHCAADDPGFDLIDVHVTTLLSLGYNIIAY